MSCGRRLVCAALLCGASPNRCEDLNATPSVPDYATNSYDMSEYYDTHDKDWATAHSVECPSTCKPKWRGDGECDKVCNTRACNWDDGDCFHDHDGCYNDPIGLDYRGNVSVTKEGLPCQNWDETWPQRHTYSFERYPDAGLGGHNFCRTVSEDNDPTEKTTGPWCMIATEELHDFAPPGSESRDLRPWGYCDVGPRSATKCAHKIEMQNITTIGDRHPADQRAPARGRPSRRPAAPPTDAFPSATRAQPLVQ